MKKGYMLIIYVVLMIAVSGCASKSFFEIYFDTFLIKFYDNTINYYEIQPEATSPGINIIKEYKENISKEFTGFINSLFVIKIPIQTGIQFQELVESNIQSLTLKLLKYKSLYTEEKKITCYKKQYAGYIMTFSYQLDNLILYGGQYYLFNNNDIVYLISFHSEHKEDVEMFIKSMKTIKCL